MIDLGSRLEPFVDHYLIDRLDGSCLRLQRPRPGNVALRFDRPWEGRFVGYATVIQDAGLFHLYYRGWVDVTNEGNAVYCYARSRDGITFERPNLGLFEVAGTRDNNVFMTSGPTHSFSPLLDRNPTAREDERFKALGMVHDPRTGRPVLAAYASADGLSWRLLREEPVITKGAFDSQNVAFWSKHEGCYVAYYRTWSEANPDNPVEYRGKRTVSRATSEDFLHWTDPVLMTYGNVPVEELYTNQTHPYFRAPHLYVALPMRFTPGRQTLSEREVQACGVDPKYAGDISDGVFMTTRGGSRYDRTFMEAFVRPGRDRANWVSRSNMAALGVVPTAGDEMSLYYQHRYANPSQYLQRYVLRTDGFASVEAPYAGGEMLTKPFVFAGDELVLNYATSGPGGIKVEIQDEGGRPAAGYTLAEADEIFGDELERRITWGGRADVAQLRGRPIRLRFVMRDADLFALRFR